MFNSLKLLLSLFCITLITACGGGSGGSTTPPTPTPPATTLSVSVGSIAVSSSSGSEEVSISSNASWTISTTADWLSLDKTSGSNNGTLTISIDENTTDTSREAEVTVVADSLLRTITITQEATFVPELSLSVATLNYTANGEIISVTITTNTEWNLSITADWLTASSNAGTGTTDITVTASENTGEQQRTANLVISAGELSVTIQVSQEFSDNGFTYDIPPDSTDMRDLASTEFTALMGVGFNIGNSLEAVGGETAWGNPMISEALIDSIKAAGFKSIRLPVAWSQFSDEQNFVIRSEWLDRVEQVVSYAISQDLFVMINIHWDGGWMQPTAADKDYVNNRLAIMWQQIATRFRDYDDRLLFAGTNEVMVEGDYGTPTPEYYTTQNSFNQTFVTTVRKTGGRNAYRHIIVQGFNTNIDHTVNFAVVPEDVINNRLLMEVHFYDPYNFTLNANSNISQWGANAIDGSKTETWANEAYVDGKFLEMRNHFYDQGLGLILGEYGVISRTDISGHENYRLDWNAYITKAALNMNMVPFYWDNGDAGNHGFALFNRSTAEQIEPELIQAIVDAGNE